MGYGDILPTNDFELFWAIVIIVFGVAVFSYMLSNLASQFIELSRSNAAKSARGTQIEQLDGNFKIGPILVAKLKAHNLIHKKSRRAAKVEENEEMSHLLKILPIHLKTQLAKYLYEDAIKIHRFLQDRDDNFYSKYLEELQPQKFKAGTSIAKAGSEPTFVYFIMHGIIHN